MKRQERQTRRNTTEAAQLTQRASSAATYIQVETSTQARSREATQLTTCGQENHGRHNRATRSCEKWKRATHMLTSEADAAASRQSSSKRLATALLFQPLEYEDGTAGAGAGAGAGGSGGGGASSGVASGAAEVALGGSHAG